MKTPICKLKTKLELGDFDFNEICKEEGFEINSVMRELSYLELKMFNDDTMDYFSNEDVWDFLKAKEL